MVTCASRKFIVDAKYEEENEILVWALLKLEKNFVFPQLVSSMSSKYVVDESSVKDSFMWSAV